MNNVLFYTVANGWYVQYQDVWEECIKRTYPDAMVECRIIPIDKQCSTIAAIARHHLEPQQLKQADYIFITDIDILITDPGLIDRQLELIKDRNNTGTISCVRKYAGNRIAAPLMVTPAWYEKTKLIRTEQWKNLYSYRHARVLDEILLMDIFKEADISPLASIDDPITRLESQHGGIHLNFFLDYHKAKKKPVIFQYYTEQYYQNPYIKKFLKKINGEHIYRRYKNLERSKKFLLKEGVL